MEKDGKELEDIVAEIEKNLHSKKFSVKVRKREFDNHGIQTGEFDIVIEGDVGTIPIKILIECRDRPSRSSQGSDWIEQLIGRKQSTAASAIVGVSTTCFSAPAIELAKREGIILRHVKELSNLEKDFTVKDHKMSSGIEVRSVRVKKGTSPKLLRKTEWPSSLEEMAPLLKKLNIKTDFMNDFGDFPSCLMYDLESKHPELQRDIPTSLQYDVTVDISPVDLKLPNGKIEKIDKLQAILTFQKLIFSGETLQIKNYSDVNTQQEIGYYSIHSTETPFGNFRHTTYTPINSDGSVKAPKVLNTEKIS